MIFIFFTSLFSPLRLYPRWSTSYIPSPPPSPKLRISPHLILSHIYLHSISVYKQPPHAIPFFFILKKVPPPTTALPSIRRIARSCCLFVVLLLSVVLPAFCLSSSCLSLLLPLYHSKRRRRRHDLSVHTHMHAYIVVVRYLFSKIYWVIVSSCGVN